MSSIYPNLTNEELFNLTEFFNFVDADHNGYITVEEMKVACGVDIDGDGTITDAEMLQCARVWLDTYLSLQDVDKDTKITLHELLKFNNDTKV